MNDLNHVQNNACCDGHGVKITDDLHPAGPHVAGKGRTKKTLVQFSVQQYHDVLTEIPCVLEAKTSRYSICPSEIRLS